MSDTRPVVYVIGFSAPPVLYLDEFVNLLLANGWDPWIILSPTASRWTDTNLLAKASGHPVRVEPRTPSEEDPLPRAASIIVAPLTFNSINKWAAGISDTLALGLLNESLALGIPVIAAPCVKKGLRHHPAYAASQRRLVEAGVVILEPDAVVTRSANRSVDLNWRSIYEQAEISKHRLGEEHTQNHNGA